MMQIKGIQLLSNGIVVRNRTSLFNCNNTLRISVGSKEENLKLIKILKNKYMKNIIY